MSPEDTAKSAEVEQTEVVETPVETTEEVVETTEVEIDQPEVDVAVAEDTAAQAAESYEETLRQQVNESLGQEPQAYQPHPADGQPV